MSAYILITASRDEEKYIEDTIISVVNQTVLPLLWVIVSDRSVDGTDDIIRHYAEKYTFIRYERIDDEDVHRQEDTVAQKSTTGRTSFGKPVAINRMYKKFSDLQFDYSGVLDGDITIPPGYYEKMMEVLDANPGKGVAGGIIYNKVGDKSWPMFNNRVGGAVQFFPRKVWEDIGMYDEIIFGEDSVVAIKLTMKGYGYIAVTDPAFSAYHHKPASLKGRNIYYAKKHVGRMQYLLGDTIWFFLIKSIRNIPNKPVVLGSILGLAGYFQTLLKGEKRLIADDVFAFHKRDQRNRVLKMLKLR